MNLFSSFQSRVHNDTLFNRSAKAGRMLDGLRLDGDLSLEMLSSVLTSMGMSVLNTAAWRHEDVRTLLHHPADITVSVCWASIYVLAALAARVAARALRQRRAASQGKSPGPVD